MEAIQIISSDLFDKIRSRFKNLEMGDKTGAVTLDPAEARFFDFDFVLEDRDLGRVSISLNDLGTLKIYYSQGITEDQDDISKKIWYTFLKEMRMFAMRRLLRFDTRDISKTNLDKNDFQYLASKAPKEETMNMNESRWNHKSTKKTSRAVKGRTEVIVRHHNTVDETIPGNRSRRKNIKAIFIQNSNGERYLYPFIHPAGAFAMAQHVDHGGVPHDPAGKAIVKMSEQIAQLQEFQRQVQRSSLHNDAMGIKERAIGRLNELKAHIEALSKRRNYEQWISEFNETEHNDEILSELDPVTFEEYKSKFTQTSFNEELGKIFPLIHSIMQEKIDLEEYVKESTCSSCHKDPCECDKEESVKEDEFSQFSEWAEAVEHGRLDMNTVIGKLNPGETVIDVLSNLPLGVDGMEAWETVSELFDIEDSDHGSDLKQRFQSAAEEGQSTDEPGIALTIFKSWVEENAPEWKQDLQDLWAQPAAQPPVEQPPAAPAPAVPQQPVAEGKEKSEMIQEIAKIVKMFYNRDNPNLGPFRGEEGILLDVEKTISEKFGDQAAQQARMVAEKFMEKLTQEWHHRHGETVMGEKDDIERLKELVGNIRHRVESMHQDEMEESDKSTIPAVQRKQQDPTNWKLKLQDLEKEKEKNISGPEGLKALKQQTGIRENDITDILKLSGLK